MACKSCKKKKKVTLKPKTDDRLLLLSDEEKITTKKELDRLIYLLDSSTFRTSEGEFIGVYRSVFEINLTKPVNQSVMRKFIFKYIEDNAVLLQVTEKKEIKNTPTRRNNTNKTKNNTTDKTK